MTTVNGLAARATASAASSSSSPTASTKDATAIDKDLFLKLLVAQMKYQDPSRPTDPSTFLSQTAQFTTVEKLGALEALSQRVYDAGRQQTATSMIGHTVTYTDQSGTTRTGVVTGVSVGSSTPNLTIDGKDGKDGLKVSLDSVTAVNTAPPPAPANAATTG